MGTRKRKRESAVKRPRSTDARGRLSSRAMGKMSGEASRTLEEHGAAIAEALAKSAMKGNPASARALVAFSEGRFRVEEDAGKRERRSLASALAAEPEWKDEPVEAAAEGCLA